MAASNATATVTAKTGPAQQNTAVVVSGVTALSIDWARMVIQLYQGQLTGPAKEYDLTGVTTFTITSPAITPVVTIS
jgi:hypothetical protein